MPYTEIKSGPNKEKMRSPSGKILTKAQVKAYYANKGRK